MKLSIAESLELAKQLKHISAKNVDVVVCPSFVSLSGVIDTLRHSSISVGAQDCFWESEGAFTGETSATYLREIGASYVILGHSERRKYLGETDEVVHKKIKMALIEAKEITLVVQVNGKVRDTIVVPVDITQQKAEVLARQSENVATHLAGKDVRNVIFVPGRLINFVV